MPINNGKKVTDSTITENSSLAGTEKIPIPAANQFTLISTIASYIRTLTQTLTNKTIALGSNTVSGTTAQFNTALSDGDFATLAGTETLTNKTLTTPTISNITSGVYTPTRSAEANLDASVTMTEAQYMRVGNTVTVSGRFTADPTTTLTSTSFEITLPVASNLGAAEDAAGVAFCGTIAGQGAMIFGVAANDTAKVQWLTSDVTSQTWSYVFSYQVI